MTRVPDEEIMGLRDHRRRSSNDEVLFELKIGGNESQQNAIGQTASSNTVGKLWICADEMRRVRRGVIGRGFRWHLISSIETAGEGDLLPDIIRSSDRGILCAQRSRLRR